MSGINLSIAGGGRPGGPREVLEWAGGKGFNSSYNQPVWWQICHSVIGNRRKQETGLIVLTCGLGNG